MRLASRMERRLRAELAPVVCTGFHEGQVDCCRVGPLRFRAAGNSCRRREGRRGEVGPRPASSGQGSNGALTIEKVEIQAQRARAAWNQEIRPLDRVSRLLGVRFAGHLTHRADPKPTPVLLLVWRPAPFGGPPPLIRSCPPNRSAAGRRGGPRVLAVLAVGRARV